MPPSRVVVVVPRQEAALHEYLQRSLACLEGIEVVLDRRTVAVVPPDERRHPSETSERKLLLCSLVHCPPRPAPPEPPVQTGNGTHRTLLWPSLRLENL
jgi:hypothetical protein